MLNEKHELQTPASVYKMDKPTALPAPPERAAGPTEGHSAHAGARGLASRGPEPPRGPWETPALLSQPHLMGRGPPATEGPPPRPPAHRTSGTTQGAATLLTRAERAGSPVGGSPGPAPQGARSQVLGPQGLLPGTALPVCGDGRANTCWGHPGGVLGERRGQPPLGASGPRPCQAVVGAPSALGRLLTCGR